MKDVPEDSIKSFPIIHHENEDMVDVDIHVSKKKNSKPKSYKKDNNKEKGKFGFNKKKDVSRTNKDKIQALFKAQEELISKCLPLKDDIEDIKLSLDCVSNWDGKLIYVDTSDDQLKVKHKEKDYIFSKKQFFKNNKFRFNLVKKYNEVLNNSVWINIKEKELQEVNHHIITIKKKRQ
jgi:hypothetical protein